MSPQFITSVIVILAAVQTMLLATSYLILLERKTASWIQNRVGPNRAGLSFGVIPFEKLTFGRIKNDFHFWGLGQPLADGLKMFLKEDYTPPFTEKALFLLAPVMVIVPALIGWAVIPWGGYMVWPWDDSVVVTIAAAPINIGVVYMLAIGSLAVYGIVVGAYGSNNKYAFLGGLRATAQMLSYEIPQGLSVLMVVLMTGAFSASLITDGQALGTWNIWYQPLLATIFFICLLAECNRAPFDLAEAEQELVGGFHTEYSSMKFALFFLGEYIHMITASAFFVLLFLGGWSLNPFPSIGGFSWELPMIGGVGLVLLKIGIFAFKVFLLCFFMMWIRWTLPRFRFDQLMKLAWRTLIPITLTLLLITGIVIYLKLDFWYLTIANVLCFFVGAYLFHKLPSSPTNRRVALAGSRFSPVVDESA